jgi:hypothetical protein
MSQYRNIISAHTFRAVFQPVSQPADSLAIGRAEFLAPVTLPATQKVAPAQSSPKVRASVNYDQYENIKMLPELSTDSFPYKGAGIK